MSLHNSRVSSPARVLLGRERLYAGALAAVLLLTLTGCPAGVVHTSTGADVAASTVHAQDLVADALQALQDAHNASVDAHDALFGLEPADVHAARRAKLLTNAAALRSGWDGLSAWKLGSSGAGMVTIANALRPTLPDLLSVAVGLKVIPQAYADAVGAFFGTAAGGQVPAALPKPGGAS